MTSDSQTYSVLRPRDLVSLTVRGNGLQEQVGPNGALQWVAKPADGVLIVDLPPQHVAETVLEYAASTSSQARLAGKSSLHFVVPRDTVVTLSTEGILAAMNKLTLKFAPIGQASQLELPYRLLLALQDRSTCCRHKTSVTASENGVAPMWHTRIVADTPSGYARVQPFDSPPADVEFAKKTPLENQMSRIAQLGRDNPGFPMEVDKLILTACGAWFAGSVTYPPNEQLVWTHRTAMGRDFYVRLLISGVLFPFGHRASVVGVSERKFDPNTKTAGLQRTFALVITEPVRDLDSIVRPHEREFPFQRVEIEPTQVIPLADRPAAPNDSAFWLKHVNGDPVMFTIRAWTAGDVVPMQLPLVFSDGRKSVDHLIGMYSLGPRTGLAAAGPPKAVVNQSIPLFVKRVGDKVQAVKETIQQVQSITVSANKVGTGFYPKVEQIEVTLPAVKQLLGKDMTNIAATLAPDLRNVAEGQLPNMLLEFDKRTMDLGGMKAGAVAAPNFDMNRISTLGPTSANLPQLFDDSAKILGVVPLGKILGAITNSSLPTVTWSGNAATLSWDTIAKNAEGPFRPVQDACKITLSVATVVEDGSVKTITDGSVTNFQIGIPIPEKDKFLVRLDFADVTFHARTGELPRTSFSITNAVLGKELRIVQQLSSYLPKVGNSGPTVEIGATQVRVAYAVAIPTPLSMGLITLQNLLLQAGVTLSLGNDPVAIDFSFGTRAHPFLVTVMGFGGGGYLELGVRAGGQNDGLERFVGGIEFGASVAMNFGVAQGEVHVFGGIVFAQLGSKVDITGYLRIGGMVRVLGLITVSVELTVSLTYSPPNQLRGAAKLVLAIDLTFWSTSVEIGASYTINGSPSLTAHHDPFVPSATVAYSVADALGDDGTSFPWQDYCQAYA